MALAGIIKAKDVVSTSALKISEFFGTSSSGDTRLSACLARVTSHNGQAFQTPEFDEYVMVISGRLVLVHDDGRKGEVCQGEGIMLKAGRKVQWRWEHPCEYVIICLPHVDLLGNAGAAPEVPEPTSRSSTSSTAVAKKVRSSSTPPINTGSGAATPESVEDPIKKFPYSPGRRSPGPTGTPDDTEGTTTERAATGTDSPMLHNIPSYIPASASEGMSRCASLSVFDQLLDTEGLLKLRTQMMEQLDDRPARYGARHLNTPVVVVSSEINPWSKTGGMAMVASSYAYEFAVRGHRVMAVAPRYADYKDCQAVGTAQIWLDGRHHEVTYFHQRQDYGAGKGCDYIFVEHPCYHRDAGLYGDPAKGGEYEDNLFRFALLSVAATEAPLVLKLGGSIYGQDVLFIANDWQAALVPTYLYYKYKRHNTYSRARSMMVLHNLGYQGKYRKSRFPADRFLGLPPEAECELQGEDMHFGDDCINLLSAGIKMADRVVTVSPNYAQEIQTPEGGHGLNDVIQMKSNAMRMTGILNGISDEWNPMHDSHLPKNFGSSDFLQGKKHCKAALERELGLKEDPDRCLIGFCGRLCYQKGVHLITEIIPWLMSDEGNGVTGHVQLVLMGKGDQVYQDQLRAAEARYKGHLCGYVGFDPTVEHRMMAGCDLLLMPSQYEPCGLPQMYAQQYATLPVVHETGGLKDSVKGLWDEERDRQTATGFLFSGFEVNRLKERLYQAVDVFQHKKDLFRQMQTNAIRSDFYWPQAIDEYEKHIDYTMEDPACRQ